MGQFIPSRTWWLAAVALIAASGLSGCNRSAEPAPPHGTEGAVGVVNGVGAGAAQMGKPAPLPGGPAGQTPRYPATGGVGSEVYSGPASPAAVAGGSSHSGQQ